MSRYNCYCPLAGTPDAFGNNFMQDSCEAKQQIPELQKTCYPHCKVSEARVYKKMPLSEVIECGNKWLHIYRTGTKMETIAESFGVSVSTVSRYIRIYKATEVNDD